VWALVVCWPAKHCQRIRTIMKDSMRDRQAQISRRLIEIDALLAETDTASDMNHFRRLSQERADIDPVVGAWHDYEAAEQAMQDARELMDEPDMRDLASEEYESASARIDALTEELRVLLLPK